MNREILYSDSPSKEASLVLRTGLFLYVKEIINMQPIQINFVR